MVTSPRRFTVSAASRVEARGKFLYRDGEKLLLRGVTYGTFSADADGEPYPDRARVASDFDLMAENGLNSVRVYTVPPRWLLDEAAERGLLVLVGLPWEQHVAFLGERARRRSIEERVRAGVRACAGHPAVLGFAVGNEIPAPIVRWHGAKAVERFLRRLGRAVKQEDPGALVTYVNFPTTEYLDLSWADFACHNVYLEEESRLEAYLARLQTLAGDRPLVMAEIGLDSRSNGLEAQADALSWQLRTSFAAGCAGALVFAWTDEWHRGGHEILDWDFGLTDRARQPKPALAAVRAAAATPFAEGRRWPSVSVVVCSYNGAPTLGDSLEGLAALDYPDVETIVVDDGSTDETAAIARRHGVRVLSGENRGLSAARNRGLGAATGEIVAYLDDDARPDPEWLHYLVATLEDGGFAAAGGPNIAPSGDGAVADCVAGAPGGPIHVLVSDVEAEHVPGCNMAFRREILEELGGFDPRFRAAGDDVDLCWRLRDAGHRIGFSPAAVVWHRRRGSVRAYLGQQRGYGSAEALLERKWPARYNRPGHVAWQGRLYGPGVVRQLGQRSRIYFGTWGSALFQSVYQRQPSALGTFTLAPEWCLVVAFLVCLSALGLAWTPLLAAFPLAAVASGTLVVQAVAAGGRALPPDPAGRRLARVRLRALVALLHLLQPVARLQGRLAAGLTPWRRRGSGSYRWPWAFVRAEWSESWAPLDERLGTIESRLVGAGTAVRRGGDFDLFDLDVRGGQLGRARLLAAVEEHGDGRQLTRVRAWPVASKGALVLAAVLAALGAAAGLDGALLPALLLAGAALALVARSVLEVAATLGAVDAALTPAAEVHPHALGPRLGAADETEPDDAQRAA